MEILQLISSTFLRALALWRGNPLTKAGLTLMTLGGSILAADATLAVIQVVTYLLTGRTDIVADVPYWISLAVGLLLIAGGVWLVRKAVPEKPPTVIAIRHQSQEALSSRLTATDLPPELATAVVETLDLDQSAAYREGRALDQVAAVRHQESLPTKLQALLDIHPEAEVAYHGIVHIPFAFLAGASLSTKPRLHLFELERGSGSWRLVDPVAPGANLGVTTSSTDADPDAQDIAIRVSISFEVPEADVAEGIGRPFHDRHISVGTPARDLIRTMAQVEEVCVAFDCILDEIHQRFPKSVRVHVFYAGPVSLAFALGRRVSRTIHHRVRVHNYEAQSIPRYSWSVDISGGLPPEAIVHRAVAAAAE